MVVEGAENDRTVKRTLTCVTISVAAVAFLIWLLTPTRPKIVFYGKVEDQFGGPLPGFPIRFEVRLDGFMRQRIIAGTTTSDDQGFFTISGYRGDELSVVPEKIG